MSAARPLEPWRWLGLPLVYALAATILFGIPLHVLQWQLPQPVFPMALAFAWAVIRPSVLAPLALLVCGLLLDIYWSGPLGFWALCLLIAYGSAFAGRSMMAGQNQIILAVWYALVTATAFVAGYLFVMLDAKSSPGIVPLAWQFVATIVLYPFAQRLIDRFEDADVRFR
ncbi:MAG: hypothetical protein ACJ798_12005 [Phenylobacterium sp.]